MRVQVTLTTEIETEDSAADVASKFNGRLDAIDFNLLMWFCGVRGRNLAGTASVSAREMGPAKSVGEAAGHIFTPKYVGAFDSALRYTHPPCSQCGLPESAHLVTPGEVIAGHIFTPVVVPAHHNLIVCSQCGKVESLHR